MLPSLYKNIILQKENTVHLFKNTYTRVLGFERNDGSQELYLFFLFCQIKNPTIILSAKTNIVFTFALI